MGKTARSRRKASIHIFYAAANRREQTGPAAAPGLTKKGSDTMSKKTDKAEQKAAKAEKKAAKINKKAAKAEKKALKAAKKAVKVEKKAARKEKKSGKAPAAKAAPVTKKAAVFGHPVRNLIIAALIGIVLGVLFIVPQLQTIVYKYCCYAAGGILALVGIVYIILYFARKPVGGEYHYEFGCGIVAVLAGAYVALSNMLFANSEMVIDFMTIVQIVGIAMILDGVMKLQYTLDLGRMGYKKWWIGLIASILGLALGVFTTFFTDYVNLVAYSVGVLAMTVYGAAYCLNGVLDLVTMIVVAVRNRKANKAAALAEAEEKVAAAAAQEPAVIVPVEEIEIAEEEPVVEAEAEAEPEIEVEVVEESVEETAEEPAFEPELPEPVLASATETEE